MSRPPVPYSSAHAVDELRRRLGGVSLRDADRLGRRLDGLRQARGRADRHDRALRELAAQVERAEALIARRRSAVPVISYPATLPVSERRADLEAAIRDHQVVVVAGETGSGKTTQLPKICLELGRGIRGTIGHTQPRRLAARTVAERIAEELHTPVGDAVGYAVRFTDQVSDRTLVKLMTDGILLAELQRDRSLLRYDTLIVDEAHERSLNIDFILGYLVELLPQRPDLKLIITSATIDPHRFAEHFGHAPVVEVSGRTYPVEIRYRPLAPDAASADDPDDDADEASGVRDQTEAVVDAVRELTSDGPGDILIFLSGEREIRDTAEVLRGLDLPSTTVLPLYARLAAAEQHRVWEPHTGRRIVLATNVAETSLTVPRVHYVIDPGTARISRYSARTKVQRLPIEPISQASANQRAGRCGRVADGICIRLYSEPDFAGRPPFTEPEILRTNLASVILQMTALGLGELERFPFLDPPDRRSVRDGLALLHELGALDGRELTAVGRQLAQLPVDPRLGRMIVEAGRQGCVREVVVLAAALSIPDPRERPVERQGRATQLHARFTDEHSDFTGYLNLWSYLREQQRERSGNQFRRMCREEFLHYLRVREWQDLRGQLRSIAAGLGLTENEQPADTDRVHASVIAGLLSHVGMRQGESRDYLGARGARFVLSPGSALARRPPAWVVAAELVETSRLYARVSARVDPREVAQLATHLVERTFTEPHWDRRRGAVMAYERVTLYGLPLVARRRVDYASVDPAIARELFIRGALVEGEWDTRHGFASGNRELLDELRALEERARRRDLVIGDDELFAFYDGRIPAEVVSSRHFDAWWKRERATRPDLLTLTREEALAREPDVDQPESWRAGDLSLPVSYRFAPGAADDGVTVHIPVDVLGRLGGAQFGWQVPALREELVTALIRALPKDLRRRFVPAPDTARAVLARLTPGQEPLLDAVQRELYRISGVLVPRDAFDLDKVPERLRPTFAVEDAHGDVLAQGKDLDGLRETLTGPVREAVASHFAVDRDGLTDWPVDLDVLPRVVEEDRSGHLVRGWPSLVDVRVAVAVRVLPSEGEQHAAMPLGTRRLIRLGVSSPVRAVQSGLGARARLLLGAHDPGGVAELLDDCADAAVDLLVHRHGGPAWSRAGFTSLRDAVRAELPTVTATAAADVQRVLAAAHEVRTALATSPPRSQQDAFADIRSQLAALLPTGFVARTGADRLGDLARYLTAIGRRLDRLPRDVELDRALMGRVRVVQAAYDAVVDAVPASRSSANDIRQIRWLIEELRVSLFAQQLGTPRPVSEQRIFRALDAISP